MPSPQLISTGQRGPRLSKAIWVLYFLIGCCLVFSFLEVIAACQFPRSLSAYALTETGVCRSCAG